MKNRKLNIGIYIIASAIIWGAVIIGSASALKGTECYESIQNVLIGGFIFHLVIIWGPLALQFKKQKEQG